MEDRNFTYDNSESPPSPPPSPSPSPYLLSLLLLLLLVVVFLYCRRHKVTRNTQHESKPPRNGDLFSIWNYNGNVAYEDIINAI